MSETLLEILADYNGIREITSAKQSKKPNEECDDEYESDESYLLLSIDSSGLFVEYDDSNPTLFVLMLQELFAGNLNPLIKKQIGPYEDFFKADVPLIFPSEVLIESEEQ